MIGKKGLLGGMSGGFGAVVGAPRVRDVGFSLSRCGCVGMMQKKWTGKKLWVGMT